MSATILQSFQVFTTHNPLVEGVSSQPAIVVIGRIHEIDQPASEARWNILFIGALPEFHQRFVFRMEREFSQGKYLDSRGQQVRGTDFVRRLNKAIEGARELTALELRKRSIMAVTWSQDNAQSLGITEQRMIAKVPFFTDTRYGFEIRDNADAQRMVLYTMKLKQIAEHSGQCDPLYTGRPMREQPNRLEQQAG